MLEFSDDAKVRFWSRVKKAPGECCWLWTGRPSKAGGYGRISVDDKVLYAHRVSWMLAFGYITSSVHVLHRCDTPACVRPEHLFLGDQRSNIKDMTQKGRQSRGVMRANARLSPDKVRSIRVRRAAGARCDLLAEEFGVSHATISDAVYRRTWKHVQ